MIRTYPSFDDLPHSDQFGIKELFPDIEDRLDDIIMIMCGYRDSEYGDICDIAVELFGHCNNVIAMIDETSPDRNVTWVYGIFYNE